MLVKHRLNAIVAVFAVIVVALCGRSLHDAWRHWISAQEVSRLASIDHAVMDALIEMRFASGAVGAALRVDPEKTASFRKDAETRDAALEATLRPVFAKIADVADPAIRSAADALASSLQAWRHFRQETDAAIARPVAARDVRLLAQVPEIRERFLAAGEALMVAGEARIRISDPALSDLVLGRALSWSARNQAGTANVLINDLLPAGRPATYAEQLRLEAMNQVSAFAFEATRQIGRRMGDSAMIQAAIAGAEAGYYGADFAGKLRGIQEILRTADQPRPSVAEWRKGSLPALNTIGGIATAFVSELDEAAARTAGGATASLALYAGLLALSLVLAAGGIAFVLRGVIRPLWAITEAAKRLAAGETAVAIPGQHRKDEIGDLAGAIQVFKNNLLHTRNLEEQAARIRTEAEVQRRAATHALAEGFEQVVSGIVGTVARAAAELQETARIMTAAASNTATQSASVAAAAGAAATNVGTVAAAAEQLGTSVQEIGRQVAGSTRLTQSAVGEAESTTGLVADLAGAADKIGAVVSLIASIAEQTNLLALNATIEAARAGAAGRGFAVVAAEVKELASQTARATDDIASQVARIQGSTRDAVGAIDGIGTRIREISAVATAIAAAIEEQGVATREIVRNVSEAASGTGAVRGNIASVAGAAEETGTAANQVLSSASALAREADHLSVEVRHFLDTVRAA